MNDKQIQVITIQNPFSPSDRLTRSVPFRPGLPVARYVEEALVQADPGVELVVSRNGHRLSEADLARVQPRPGDYLLIAPAIHGGGDGGKNIAATLAGLALMVVTMGVGSVVAGGTFWGAGFAPIASWGWWAWAAAIGTSLVGGWLLSTLFPAPEAKDPPPGWNSLSPIQGQGSVVGETFGTTRTGGTVLQQRIVPDGDKQYLYYLATGGAGEIDDIDGVKIGKNPVENYADVQLEYRLGANDQTVIPGFDDTLQTQILSYNLQQGADWSTQQTIEATGTGLEAILECPTGLYRREDDGDLKTATVQVELQYRAVGAVDWIAWPESVTRQDNTARRYASDQIIVNGDKTAIYFPGRAVTVLSKNAAPLNTTVVSSVYYPGTVQRTVITLNNAVSTKVYAVQYVETTAYHEISGATSSPVRRTIRILGLAAAQYEVRARCIYKSGTGDRYATDVYWTALSHVITDDFIRPGKVLVAVKALATDQLQGVVPEITWLQTRENVWVWDPAENGGAGGYVQKPAYNPAWAAYDLIHRCRSIKNIHTGAYEFVVKGYPANRILYQEFADWADFCTARDLRFDYYYDQEMDLWSALKLPESLGRGKALMRGTRWGAMWDGPAEVSMQFDAGNIALDSFGLDYQGTKNRARAIEIRFRDAALDYEWNYVPVIPPGYDASLVPSNPVRIDLPGCTRLDQAYREGRYRLWLNSLVRMASWGADVDAIGCQIGQRVRVAHDVILPETSVSGRLEDADANSVTLDRTVTMEPGASYVAALRMANDGLVEKTLENQAGVFSRASTAYDRLDGHSHAAGAVRYEPGPWAGYQASLAEEGTTSLLGANTFLDTDTDADGIANGFVAYVTGTATGTRSMDTSVKAFGRAASQKIIRTGGAAGDKWGIRYPTFSGVVQPNICSFLVDVAALDAGAKVRLYADYLDAANTWLESKYYEITTTTGGFVKYSLAPTTNTSAAKAIVYVWIEGDNGTVYVQAIQSENKAYGTTFHNGTRSAEFLSVPLAGMSPAAGAWEQWVYVDSMVKRQVTGQTPYLFKLPGATAGHTIELKHLATAEFRFVTAGASATGVNFADSLISNGWHLFKVTWTASAAKVFVDNILRGTITDPSLPGGFAASGYIGSESGTSNFLNALHAGIRLSNIDRSAETADLTKPLPVDKNTVALWPLNGNLDFQSQHVRVTAPFAADTEPAVYEDGTHFLVAGDRTAAYAGGNTVILEHGDNSQIAVVVGGVYDVGLNQTSVEVAGADVEETLSAVRYAYTQPRKYDNYAFGETGKAVKDFRLLSIRRSGDLQYELAGLEYAEYTEAADIPAPVIVEPAGSVTHLTATESKDPDGTRWCNISWVPPRVNYTGARIVVDGVQVGRVGIEATAFRFPLESDEPITILVTALDRWGMDYGSAVLYYTPADTTAPATPVSAPSVTPGINTLTISYPASTDPGLLCYEIQRRQAPAEWDAANKRYKVPAAPAWGEWTDVEPMALTTAWTDQYVSTNQCYQYRYRVTDRARNSSGYSPESGAAVPRPVEEQDLGDVLSSRLARVQVRQAIQKSKVNPGTNLPEFLSPGNTQAVNLDCLIYSVDQCTGGTAIESGHYSNYTPDKAFDDLYPDDPYASSWISSDYYQSKIGYYFPAPKTIREIRINQRSWVNIIPPKPEYEFICRPVSAITVEYSQDGIQWISIGTYPVSPLDKIWSTIKLAERITALYWRLVGNNTDRRWGVWEIEMKEAAGTPFVGAIADGFDDVNGARDWLVSANDSIADAWTGLPKPAYILSLTRSGTVATAVCYEAHGFLPGMEVIIAEVTTPGWNGTYVVTGVPQTDRFTFTVPDTLTTPADFIDHAEARHVIFLYIDRDPVTAEITFGYTLLPPKDDPTQPGTPATDQHWFDPSRYVMERYDGAAWVPVQRLFVGECTVDVNGYVGSIVHYAPLARYDSGWFDIVSSQNYAQYHNLGTIPLDDICILARAADGTIARMRYYDYSSAAQGVILTGLTRKSCFLRTASIAASIDSEAWGTGATSKAAVQARVIMKRGY